MLIKVFGIWLMANSVVFISPENYTSKHPGLECRVNFIKGQRILNATCDEVAEEINKQLKELNNGQTE